MKFDAKFWQRAFLAFTTGVLLAFAARMSEKASSAFPDAPAGFSAP